MRKSTTLEFMSTVLGGCALYLGEFGVYLPVRWVWQRYAGVCCTVRLHQREPVKYSGEEVECRFV